MTDPTAFSIRPDLAAFDRLVRDAYDRLPPMVRRNSNGLVIQVAEFPDTETMEAMDIASPYDLLGLYHGKGSPVIGTTETGMMPDRVYLYRRPILRFWEQGDDPLEDVITNVLVHEIAHHFGLSDDEIYGLEDEAEARGN